MAEPNIAKMIAKLSARPDGVEEEVYAEREAASLAAYERKKGDPILELSTVRTFAMTAPRWRGFDLVLTQSEESGWRDIERWWLLETLSTHLIGPHIASNAQVLLGYAIALGEVTAANWMASALASRMKQHPDAYEGQFFPRFLQHLHRAYMPGSAAGPGSIPELGPYASVFEGWSDVEKLAEALASVCTYRIEVVGAEGDDEVSEFRFAPLLPVEVAAVKRLRAARDEPAPHVSHPLMACPLAEIPSRRTYEPAADAWYQRTVEAGVAAGRLDPDFIWPSPAQ